MTLNKLLLLTTCFVFIFTMNTNSQEKQYMFKRITKENGLSNNHVTTFLRDNKGFMWIGTKDGLNRFDGYSIKVFGSNPEDSTTIRNNEITFLAEDYNKNIWIGNGEDLDIYNPEENRLIHADSIFNGNLDFLTETKIQLEKDIFGNYWYASSKQGLYKYFVEQDSLVKVIGIHRDLFEFQRHQITGFSQEQNGNIWCINAFGKIYKIDNESCTIVDSMQIDLGNELYFMKILVDFDGDIWCFDQNNNQKGIFMIDRATNEIKLLLNNELNTSVVRCINEDNEKKIWIGTDHGGISIINKENNTLQTLLTDQIDNKSITENTISDIYKDYEGFMWVGSFKKGLSYYHKDLYKFDHYKINIPKKKSTQLNDIDNFVEDEKGNLWIGTNGAGIIYFDRNNHTFKQYKHDPNNINSISADVVIGLTRDKNNNIWIGTYFGGLNKWDGKQFTHFKRDTTKQGTITDDRVWGVCEDSEGKLWLATLLGGVNVFDPVTEKVIKVLSPQEIFSNVVFTIIEDKDGVMWFATVDGITSYNKTTKTLENYCYNPDDKTSLSNNYVFDICEDNRGYLWVATANGINHFNKITKIFTRIQQKDGLADNRIIKVVEDKDENIWVSTSTGISCIDIKNVGSYSTPEYEITNYSDLDGLQGKDFNEKSAYVTSKGEIIFGGSNGYNLFYPQQIQQRNIESNILFTDFLLFNKSINNHMLIDNRLLFNEDISYTKNVNLKYDENLFTIEFANLNFFHPEATKYRYQLIGFNDNWLETDAKNRKITYTNLDPGAYTFNVQILNNEGNWNNTGASLVINISPPWWRTWWFRILSVLSIIVVAGLIIFWRFNQLNSQRKLLKLKVKERTEELLFLNKVLQERQEEISQQNDELNLHRNKLEHMIVERTIDLEKALKKAEESDRLKSAFLANMSHEIRTPMNAIVGFSRLIRDEDIDSKERNRYVDIIHNNCDSLVVLIDDILDISKIEADQIAINKQPFDLLELLDEVNRYYKIKEPENVNIIYKKPNNLNKLKIINDATRIKQVIQNLMNNSIKFTDEGYIKFGLQVLDNKIIIYVEDTGIGIDPAKKDEIFIAFVKAEQPDKKYYRGAGLGLAICKKISILMGGDLTFKSESGKGTIFHFAFPFEKA